MISFWRLLECTLFDRAATAVSLDGKIRSQSLFFEHTNIFSPFGRMRHSVCTHCICIPFILLSLHTHTAVTIDWIFQMSKGWYASAWRRWFCRMTTTARKNNGWNAIANDNCFDLMWAATVSNQPLTSEQPYRSAIGALDSNRTVPSAKWASSNNLVKDGRQREAARRIRWRRKTI